MKATPQSGWPGVAIATSVQSIGGFQLTLLDAAATLEHPVNHLKVSLAVRGLQRDLGKANRHRGHTARLLVARTDAHFQRRGHGPGAHSFPQVFGLIFQGSIVTTAVAIMVKRWVRRSSPNWAWSNSLMAQSDGTMGVEIDAWFCVRIAPINT